MNFEERGLGDMVVPGSGCFETVACRFRKISETSRLSEVLEKRLLDQSSSCTLGIDNRSRSPGPLASMFLNQPVHCLRRQASSFPHTMRTFQSLGFTLATAASHAMPQPTRPRGQPGLDLPRT